MKRGFPLLLTVLLTCGILWAQDRATDHRQALTELASRAASGDAKAMYQLAKLHDTGYDTIPRDSARSTALYLEAARKGYGPAMNFIGFRYYKGEGLSRDIDSALYWIRKAAEGGDITAATNLGYLLTEGEGIAHDEEEAAQWLTVASEAGVVDAQKHLIDLMKEKWAALPSDSALSHGLKYYSGAAPYLGVKLIEIASRDGSPKALALLGDAYSKGRGTDYDHQKSIEYFYQGAERGDHSAQFILGELLDIFPDVLAPLIHTKDPSAEVHSSAQYWYEKAAEGGINDSDAAYQSLYSPLLP